MKINFNAAWFDNKAGLGFIARDMEGFVNGGGVFFNSDMVKADWVDADCLMRCLTWAKNKG